MQMVLLNFCRTLHIEICSLAQKSNCALYTRVILSKCKLLHCVYTEASFSRDGERAKRAFGQGTKIQRRTLCKLDVLRRAADVASDEMRFGRITQSTGRWPINPCNIHQVHGRKGIRRKGFITYS